VLKGEAHDARLSILQVQLCGLSRGEDYVWGVVKDEALRHRKFEKDSTEEVVEPTASKRPRTGFFNALHAFIEEGPPLSSIAKSQASDSTHALDAAIDAYESCLCFHKKLIHLASGETIQLHLFFSRSCHWQPQSQQCPQLRLFVSDFSRQEGKC
jgi:hypothetical protein